ncbi:hypothetical protein F5146DRAFT_1039599 [Armillaria mellea]|nr:hypothetical protein F5146DRAFT_1039599 [Armillaria mellea]
MSTLREEASYTGSEKRCLVAFYVLQLTGFMGLLIILLTGTFSPTVAKRHVCWLNFIISWIISTISYSLLVGHSMDWEPPHGLCLTQAILVYSVPTLTACTTTALVIHVGFSSSFLSWLPMTVLEVHFNWTPFVSSSPCPINWLTYESSYMWCHISPQAVQPLSHSPSD